MNKILNESVLALNTEKRVQEKVNEKLRQDLA